jgi:MFS family permease
VDTAVIAAMIGAVAMIAAAVIPELLKRGTRQEKHHQRMLVIIVVATSTMFVVGAIVVVRLIELSKIGWAIGALAVCFLGATIMIVGSLGVLAGDPSSGRLNSKAPDSKKDRGQHEGDTS